MKDIVGVSLGSSKRDHEVKVKLLNEDFRIRRIGTDGDFDKAIELLEELDGKVDAIGLGGIDIYLYSGTKRYELVDGVKLRDAVKKTPVVDGSGLKNTLERDTVEYLDKNSDFDLKNKTVLMVSAVDRFGMAQALTEAGCKMIFGDLIFALNIPKPVYDLHMIEKLADELLPKICKTPFRLLYPTGKEQEKEPDPKYAEFYNQADIIAGDFHLIRKYMPPKLEGKIILTNTVTTSDVEELKKRGVSYLITTTPEYEGRSFGTNVLEAALVTLIDKPWQEVNADDYSHLIKELNLKPRIEKFSQKVKTN
ncbi:MAG: quinate 5-dehydrogenase [Actinobacteria bacterium]|nr:quinate 5-dehydrogenase [Actinomycetota bacterium]